MTTKLNPSTLEKTLAFLQFTRDRCATGPMASVPEMVEHIKELDAMIEEVKSAQRGLTWDD